MMHQIHSLSILNKLILVDCYLSLDVMVVGLFHKSEVRDILLDIVVEGIEVAADKYLYR
jgi:hypothetical protein